MRYIVSPEIDTCSKIELQQWFNDNAGSLKVSPRSIDKTGFNIKTPLGMFTVVFGSLEYSLVVPYRQDFVSCVYECELYNIKY